MSATTQPELPVIHAWTGPSRLPPLFPPQPPKQRINLIGLSSGKDSTVLLGWAIHESGYPRESIWPTFCDTENEYDEVYDQIRDLNEYCVKHGVRPITTLRASGDWGKVLDVPFISGVGYLEREIPICESQILHSIPKDISD